MENDEENKTLEQTKIAAADKQEIVPDSDIGVSKDEETVKVPSGIKPSQEESVPISQYRELQSAFTKKSQLVKEYEIKVNSIPSREDIIREYLLKINSEEKPNVMVSSSSNYDFAKEKKPTTLNEAEKLARRYFANE
jgi:hypothetical protein